LVNTRRYTAHSNSLIKRYWGGKRWWVYVARAAR
jgi:hypothetical protein